MKNPGSYILIDYDGDGSARMSFRRIDNVPLTFPDELLTYYQRWYQGDKDGRILAAEEFKALFREHSSWTWKSESGESVQIGHDYNDKEGSGAFLVLGKNINSKGRFHHTNQSACYIID